ncbi:lipase [Rhodococcoides trifolii]|uniref:Lipase n=1 Tax=Rhodococcoides trifolii TaxID=908250 RepID=A0A917G5X6_9NOCA|nr:lipase family protein [Rhodococcus trifolii]GGG24410.1 lipase [Rhodococcus trifolii]
MRRRARFAAFTLAVGLLPVLLGATPSAWAEPIEPTPVPGTLYAQTPDLIGRSNGDVVASRRFSSPLYPGADIWQIQYRSSDSRGQAIAAVSTVLAPANRVPGGPLLSYQPFVNALGLQCAPSESLFGPDPTTGVQEREFLNLALVRGWTVAVPDHLGPKSAYGAARLGGQITLDGIRAAQRVPELQLGASRVAMAGYSGGGMATAWAAALAPTYAPEIDLVGVAAGGVPADIDNIARSLGFAPHQAFGLAFAAALGLEREYPDRLPITEQLNDEGIRLRDQVVNACTPVILATGAFKSAIAVSKNTSLVDSPEAQRIIDENSLVRFDGVPTAPILLWASDNDPLIPIGALRDTAARYCAGGATVEFDVVHAPQHIQAAFEGLPAALTFLNNRFDGVAAPDNCPR